METGSCLRHGVKTGVGHAPDLLKERQVKGNKVYVIGKCSRKTGLITFDSILYSMYINLLELVPLVFLQGPTKSECKVKDGNILLFTVTGLCFLCVEITSFYQGKNKW